MDTRSVSLALWLSIPSGAIALAQSPAPPPPEKPSAKAPANQPPGSSAPGTGASPAAPAAGPTLVEDFQTAYSWAENAKSLADEFATKAESDGVLGAASLFRASARSLGILSDQYSETVKKLGGTPSKKADSALPKPKTTKENLKAFAKLLTDRRTGGLNDAASRHRTNPNREATKTLRYEREALTELARFASDAADGVEKLKASKKDFFVSRPCGYVTDKLVADKCPVCKTGKDQFEKVN